MEAKNVSLPLRPPKWGIVNFKDGEIMSRVNSNGSGNQSYLSGDSKVLLEAFRGAETKADQILNDIRAAATYLGMKQPWQRLRPSIRPAKG